MSEKSELDFLRQQLIKYAEDISWLYQELKTGFSKDAIEEKIKTPEDFAGIITTSKEMLAIFLYIELISRSSQPVLITGETGVGKELIARSIHAASGLKGHMVTVNAAGLDDNLFSDALFGHIKGAFTGADKGRDGMVVKASGGTLFLDEIGVLSPASQVKLLRLLQEGEYLPIGHDVHMKTDVRIIAATNEDLWELQNQGKFRQDLNFRLRVHHIYVPPLRERTDDIPSLVDHFLNEAARDLKKKNPTPHRNLFNLLGTYSFPGNVRELKAMVFDAVSRHKTGPLSLEAFKSHITTGQKSRAASIEKNKGGTMPLTFSDNLPTIKQATRLLVDEAMKRAGSNQTLAAGMLGISQQALSKRLKAKN